MLNYFCCCSYTIQTELNSCPDTSKKILYKGQRLIFQKNCHARQIGEVTCNLARCCSDLFKKQLTQSNWSHKDLSCYFAHSNLATHTDLINERNEHHSFPFLLFTIQISLEIYRIIINNIGLFHDHQVLWKMIIDFVLRLELFPLYM